MYASLADATEDGARGTERVADCASERKNASSSSTTRVGSQPRRRASRTNDRAQGSA